MAENEKHVIEIPQGMPADEVAAIRQNARDTFGPDAKIQIIFGGAIAYVSPLSPREPPRRNRNSTRRTPPP